MKATPTIEINLDIPCPECGKMGATQGGKGRCLECAKKAIERRWAMQIGNVTKKEVLRTIEGLLDDYTEDLNEAYLKKGEDPLAISIAVKLSAGDGATDIETTMSFTKEKIKDKANGRANESQQGLFDGKEE